MARLMLMKFDEALLKEGGLDPLQLEEAKLYALGAQTSLEHALMELGYITNHQLLQVKGKAFGLRTIDLSSFPIAADAATAIPEQLAREYTVIPVIKRQGTITLAMADPLDMDAIDAVENRSGLRVDTVVSTEAEIHNAIETLFGVYGQINDFIKIAEHDRLEMEIQPAFNRSRDLSSLEGPIAQIVNLIITQAVNVRASDIHLEPLEKRLRVRFRVDGILQEVLSFDKIYQAALTSSAKIICSMDISEKRLPQDGRCRIAVKQRAIDLRASTFPTMHGEKFVFRILDKESANLDLSQLDVGEKQYEELKKVIQQPHGLFLVVGPTGSGKTTTLYSVLKEVNTPTVNVITLEDPVEFDLDTVNQGQVNVKAGLTFATGLRAMLRQDPDIVMIGEIRDTETAEIATQAALTGHLVLTTLHTNSAPGTIARLTYMGVEPFLIASSLAGILAQRLVRRLCPKCKKSYTPTPEVLHRFGLSSDIGCQFYKPVGCRECTRTGYRGRIGVFEFMVPNDEIRHMIIANKSTDDIREQAIWNGMQTLKMDSVRKVIAGLTSLEEILRVTGGH